MSDIPQNSHVPLLYAPYELSRLQEEFFDILKSLGGRLYHFPFPVFQESYSRERLRGLVFKRTGFKRTVFFGS